MSANNYYSLKNIDKTNALYRMIIGQRSNGKTYSICNKIFKEHIKNGIKGAYIRRFDEEITPKNIKQLFDPVIANNNTKWTDCEYKNHIFTLVTKDKDGNIIERDSNPLCQCFSLNTWERAKGADRGFFKYILFDEFMTRNLYLSNEFVTFSQLLSSLIRDRDGSVIYMVANTVSKYCPYFKEMYIDINKIKQGDINLYQFDGGLTIAIEYCNPTKNVNKISKYFNFDNPQLNMITTGVWEIKNYPHLPIDYKQCELIYKFYVNFNNQLICGNILRYDDIFIYFYPQTKYVNLKKCIVYDTQINVNPLHCQTLNEGVTKAHILINNLITNNKIFFSDNETGENIRNWLNMQKAYKKDVRG